MPKTIEITVDQGVWAEEDIRLDLGDRATVDDDVAERLVDLGVAKIVTSRRKAKSGDAEAEPEADADAGPPAEVDTDASH